MLICQLHGAIEVSKRERKIALAPGDRGERVKRLGFAFGVFLHLQKTYATAKQRLGFVVLATQSTSFSIFAFPLTEKSALSRSGLTVTSPPFFFVSMLTIQIVKPATVFALASVNDFQPARLEPSEISVPPTFTSSTQNPAGISSVAPSDSGSLNARKASRWSCPRRRPGCSFAA